jgi:cytidylate kinase
LSIITVSRYYGSGGSEVAALDAKKLGWSLLDNTVVDMVAARLGITPAQVAAREERVPSLVERITDALALGSQEWITPMTAARRAPTDDQLIEVTRHVLEEAVSEGSLVIVGRGAPAMLAERSDAFHVFCYAPRAALISRVMERERVGSAEASKLVDEMNAHRESWVRKYFDRTWTAHENYDLSLNTAWLGIPAAADLIVFAARTRFGL